MMGKISGLFKRKIKAPVGEKTTAYNHAKEKTPVSMKVLDPIVGPGTRVWAFLGDVSLAQAFYMVIGSEPMLVDLSKEIYSVLLELSNPYLPHEAWVNAIKEDITPFVPFITLFFSLRIVSVLLTGVSPAQFCMGLKSHSNLLWARVGGVLRILFEMLTMPFLIFDVPALFSRRTLKEVLSFTGISMRNSLFRFMGAIIFIPCIFAFTFISPMFNELQYFETGVPYEEVSVMVKKNKNKRKKIKKNAEEAAAVSPAPAEGATPEVKTDGEKKEPNSTVVPIVSAEVTKVETKQPEKEEEVEPEVKLKEFQIQSDLFRFNTDFIKKDDLILIPDWFIDVVKDKKNKMVMPLLRIASSDTKAQAEMKVFKMFDLSGLVKIFEEGNPLAFFFYPNLTKWSSNKDIPTLRHNSNSGKFTINQMTELELIMERSLKLNINVVQDYALEQGPFIKGLVDVRRTLAELIEAQTLTQAQILKAGKTTVLILKGESENDHFLIPMSFPYGIIYKMSWKTGKNLDQMSRDFYGDLFREVEGRERIPAVKFFNEDSTVFSYQSPFAILDLFFSKKINLKEREIFYQYFFNYYYEIAGKALKTEDKGTIDLVTKSLKHFSDMMNFQTVSEKEVQDKLKADIITLTNAINAADRSYFGLDLPSGVLPAPPTPTPVPTPSPAPAPVLKNKKKGA
ncbi:MAG: hypothetical protein ACOYL6_15650 [Bacteriovoracaceae bacterium]